MSGIVRAISLASPKKVLGQVCVCMCVGGGGGVFGVGRDRMKPYTPKITNRPTLTPKHKSELSVSWCSN